MKIAEADIKISKNVQALAKELDEKLALIAGQRMRFSLLVFNSETGSRMNYISNADRESVELALTSLLDAWSEGMPDIAAHKLDS